MEIKRPAMAGTLESSDVFVTVEPNADLVLELESVVLEQFGDDIRTAVNDTLTQMEVTGCRISLKDRGALECTIRARVETALLRAAKEAI